MKTERRRFSAGFKSKVAIKAIKEAYQKTAQVDVRCFAWRHFQALVTAG